MHQLAARVIISVGNLLIYLRYQRWVRQFRGHLGYWPNLFYPQTKNEKLLWRKIFDRNPMYRLVTDKLVVRQFVKTKCPELSMSEILWIGAHPDQIPEAFLQPGVVIKTNNGCRRNVFIRNAPVNRPELNERIANWICKRYELIADGEWAYDNIQPFAFIERLITSPGDPSFVEISCHVVMGKCLLITVEKDVKQENERIALYDREMRRLPIYVRADATKENSSELPADFPVPATFKKAVQSAECIAEEFDYVRVDFMSTADGLYFCECTVFPMGGFSIINIEGDGWIASAWDIRNSWFMRHPQRGIRGTYQRLYYYCL
jgi:hypothetical protein